MAETITIGGKKLPKTLVFAGAAATVGIVGYAYMTNSGGGDEEAIDPGLVDTMGDERIPPTTVDTYDVNVDNSNAVYKTDSEWYSAGIELLVNNFGVADTPTAAAALNAFLQSKDLTAAQVPMVQYVVNTIGHPPSGQKAIRQGTATPTTPAQNTRGKPGPITGLVLSTNAVDINAKWNNATRAAYYQLQLIAGASTVLKSVRTTTGYWRLGGGLRPNHQYRITVWPVSANGIPGDKVTAVARTKVK